MPMLFGLFQLFAQHDTVLQVQPVSQKMQHLFCEDAKGYESAFSGDLDAQKAYKSIFSQRGQGGPVKQWGWSEVGPSYQPVENNPGGTAIPGYAEGRGNGTGRINYIYIDPTRPKRIFACSPTGGLFVSNNHGKQWYNGGTDYLPISGVSSISVNPLDPDQWFISTGDGDDKFMFSDGVWRTDDAGKTWENINGIKNGKMLLPSESAGSLLYIAEIVSHPCDFNRLFAATSEGLFVTNNALDAAYKVKWKRVATSFFYDILILPENPSVVIAGGERMMVSKDCGSTWTEMATPEYRDKEKFPFMRLTLQASTTNVNGIWVAVSCAEKFSQSPLGNAELFYFDVKSEKWEFIRSLSQGMNNLITTRARAFAVHPSDENFMLVGNVQPVYRSTDMGLNFNRIDGNQMHDDIHHLVFEENGLGVWAGHDGGVSYSKDGGITWESKDFGIGVANVFGLSVAQADTTVVLFGAYDTGCTLGNGQSWKHVTWGDGFETIISPHNPKTMIASKQNGHLNRSDDGGDTFEKVVSPRQTKTEWHTWIKAHPTKENVIFCSGEKLMRSSNNGDTWDAIFDTKKINNKWLNVYRFWLSESNPNVMYIYVLDESKIKPHLFRTANLLAADPENVQWIEVQSIPKSGWLSDLIIDPDNPTHFWLAYKDAEPDGKLWRFNGDRYIDISRNLGWAVITSMAIDDGDEERLYIGTNHGVFTRNRLEYDYTLLSGLPGTWIRSLSINRVTKEMFVGT
ncbi:MAG: hypothetical protein RL226_257, partial [Bacteroidota bacterium]